MAVSAYHAVSCGNKSLLRQERMFNSHLPDIMAFLGKEDSLARIRKAIALG